MTEDKICGRHGVKLEKHRDIGSGEVFWTCPKEKCSYKENEKGEKI